MDRNRETFRNRFLAYKDGKSVNEIYGIPKFEDGRSGKVDWKRWDDAQTTSYTVPFIEDKAITLTNAGRATGARLSTNLLDSLADNAMRAEVPVRTAIGLATKESTLGNPTDDRTAWNQSSAIRQQFNGIYPGTHQHINGGRNLIHGQNLINYHKGDIDNNVFTGAPHSNSKSVIQEGLEFYRQHPDRYNPGQPGYQKAVEARGNETMKSPEILKWYKEWEAKQVKVMRPKQYSLPTIQSTAPKKFGKYADGKLPRYKDGKRYLWDDQTQSWDRITDSDVANAMAEWAFTPTTTRAKFDYENTPNPVKPLSKNEAVVPDNTFLTRQFIEKANNTRTWRSDVADVFHAIGEGALLASSFAAPEIEPLVYPAYNAAKTAITSALTSNAPAMQYLRYPVGKLIYGLDALFPTLYRKLKTPLLQTEDGLISISNPNSRFAFEATGEESPLITNFTFDAPVRSHGAGNWDVGQTLAMPGRKVLLGRNVISTEPSDLFTFGDNIKIPARDVTMISGDADEISLASKYGLNVKTSPEILKSYLEGFGKSLLEKDDHSKYAKDVELFARELFGSPRKKDVDFMNFVLLPQIKGRVYNPNQLDYLIREGIEPFGDRIGNAELRPYFLDPDRWKHLLYDPATHAEANFRKANGIVLKKKIPLNKRK